MIFLTRLGDHRPRHVHVFKDKLEILKWDLEHNQVMEGKITKQIRKLIEELIEIGEL